MLLSSWCSARKVQLCFLCDLAFHLQNCGIQQKLHEMHKIWPTWGHKEFAWGIRLSVIQFNRKYMKLTKFGILVNKTTSLSTSIIRGSNISRGCAKILEILEGRGVNFGGWFWKIQRGGGGGVIRQIPSGYFLEPHISTNPHVQID